MIFYHFYCKNAWHSASNISWFPNVGQLSYAGMHRDICQKCMTTTQDAGWLVSLLDVLFHKTHIKAKAFKVPRLDMCRSIISLNKIALQMWHNHLFSQRNKTAERAVGLGVGGDREGRGLDKLWKRRAGNEGGGGLHKVRGLGDLGPLFQLCFE